MISRKKYCSTSRFLVAALVAILVVPYLVLHRWESFRADVVGVVPMKMRVVASKYNENCWRACRRQNMACDVALFPLINNCETMRKLMPTFKGADCAEVSGWDMPVYDKHFKRFHISVTPTAHPPGCGGRHYNTLRACPVRFNSIFVY